MTLLVAVADACADRELVAAARALAAAAGWEARGVHVRESGLADLGSAELEDLELIDLDGDAAAEIAGLVRRVEVDAVAVGLRTTSEPGLGHVTEALLRGFAAPLLLVRPGMRPLMDLRRLIVPLEGSPSASSAMLRADAVLCARGREIVMLHVVTSDTPGETGSMPAPRMVDQEHYEWADWREEFAMRFSQCPEGGRHRVSVRVGEPASAIVEEAEAVAAELIVMSWNGSFDSGRGAVVAALLETAPCPLLLVPMG
jgi:nucleotide-binding universal stress UspA family protein